MRPIFWKNRTKSYIQRTESWDEFPNGRWGDSRSPAFGELDGYGVSLKHPKTDCLEMWNHPSTVDDVAGLFAKYCTGDLSALPWCAQQLDAESEIIRQRLAAINMQGFLTINSQPAVNGVRSSDKIHGWGPHNGYVYQKAYLEFFVSPEQLDALVAKIGGQNDITYYAVNCQGDLKTNNNNHGPNAVTWGVFPGKEIVQPTIVDATAFMAWKEEAFELWAQWASLYEAESASSQLLKSIKNQWYLINIVDNNFVVGDGIWKLFDLEAVGNLASKLNELNVADR